MEFGGFIGGITILLWFVYCCWIFFVSLSFGVSANLTTSGDEQPCLNRIENDYLDISINNLTSIVWDWCMDLIALIAHCRFWKVIKAHPRKSYEYSKWNSNDCLPRLLPFVSRSIVQSSMGP